jgi:cation diffusion facilitator CzcD-associated flavoprotein CzcO
MKKTAKKYEIERYVRYKHVIKHAQWDEREGKWRLRVEHNVKVFEDSCDMFINAGGVLK